MLERIMGEIIDERLDVRLFGLEHGLGVLLAPATGRRGGL